MITNQALKKCGVSTIITDDNNMKTKFTFIFLIFCGLTFIKVNTFAQTNVSGFISSNTNWTLSGSPYIITGNTLLDSGFVLTIDPGVIIKFNANKSLQISGALRAIGTSVNPVKFTSNAALPSPGDWQYILFNDNSEDYNYTLFTGSIMEYCIVEYAGALSPNGAINIVGAHPFINFCTIKNNLASGISLDDTYGSLTSEVIKITNCNIHHNCLYTLNNSAIVGGGINILVNQAGADISNNTVYNNVGQGAGGISMWTNNHNWTLANNVVTNNTATQSWGTGGGILITGGSQLGNVYNNLVYGNSANNGGGIYLQDIRWSGSLSNNIVVNNTATMDGGGIYFSNSFYVDPNMQVQKNMVIENTSPATSGIYLPNATNTTVKYNTITRNHSVGITPHQQTVYGQGSFFNYNNIFGNDGHVVPYYEYYNPLLTGSLNNLDARHNYWGTSSSSIIDNNIYDYFDNGTLSIVYYSPFQSAVDTTAPVTPPINVIKTDLGGSAVHLTWNANPEMDIAGYKIYWGSPTGYSFAHVVDAGNVNAYTLSGVSIADSIAVTAYDTQMNSFEDQFEGHESWYTYAVGIQTPSFSASPIIICPADTVFFSANTPELYSYAGTSWSWTFTGGNPNISNAQNPKVIYNTSGVYNVKLKVTNIAGSDSISYSNYITVNHVSYGSISPTVCNTGSYTSPSGLHTWYSGGIYHDTIPNNIGCDSIITINLTLSYNTYASIFPVSCSNYVSPSGNHIWASSGTYQDTIPNYLGCDSIISVYLTINSVDTSVTINGIQLTSNAYGATYKWLNCSNGFSIIPGENNQSYTPVSSGNYAVEVTQSTCVDTSTCHQITIIGINNFNQNKTISIYPNPASDILTLKIDRNSHSELTMNIYNVIGVLVKTEILKQGLAPYQTVQQQFNIRDLSNGVYMIEIKSDDGSENQKLIIQR